MIETVTSLVTGGALVGFGYLLGRARRPARNPPVTGPVCGCGHHLSYHRKPGKKSEVPGACRHPVGFLRDPCSCEQYTGPAPLPDFYAPEILP